MMWRLEPEVFDYHGNVFQTHSAFLLLALVFAFYGKSAVFQNRQSTSFFKFAGRISNDIVFFPRRMYTYSSCIMSYINANICVVCSLYSGCVCKCMYSYTLLYSLCIFELYILIIYILNVAFLCFCFILVCIISCT